jgi:ATP-dependent DNA ligase
MTEDTPRRSDPEKHREQVRAANRARYRAVRLLIAENQSEFDKLYAQQCRLEGVVAKGPHASRRDRRDRLEAEIAELRAAIAELGAQAIIEDGDGDGTAA